MKQHENENLIKKTMGRKIPSSSLFSIVVLSLCSFFFIFYEVIFGAPSSIETLAIFDSKLEIAAEDITAKVLLNQTKVVLAVVDFFNYETQERDKKAEALEEQLTDILIEKLPKQVVPYFEIVFIRLEWRSRFSEILHEPLTEDIAKLANADWLLTGTYETIDDLLSVNLILYELQSGDLLWQTVVGKERNEENELEEIIHDETVLQNLEQPSLDIPSQIVAKFHAPFFPPVSQQNILAGESSSLDKPNFRSSLIPHLIPPVKAKGPEIPEAMVLISGGEFLMGSDLGNGDELPDHFVFIESFFLDQHEVTNDAYSSCLSCVRGHGGFDTTDPQQPTVYVDWNNAKSFCENQNKRLPTEAEWEYAARAGSEGEYSFGDNVSILQEFAWLETNTVDLGLWGAKIVSTKKANPWGLFDMYGNVMEWVHDYYTQDYFASARQLNNPKGPNLALDEKFPLRVVRGGAWGGLHDAGTSQGLRSAKRYSFVEWTRSFQIGFRCAMDVNSKISTN